MKMKKTTSVFLALALACSMNITAFAADTSPKTVTEDGGTAVAEVKGTYKEGQSAAKVYKVDIAWTDLNFTYTAGSAGTWNPETHTYDGSTEGSWGDQSGTITITNHSNAEIEAWLSYEAAAGYESAGMAFDHGDIQWLSSADNGKGEDGAGKARSADLPVRPTGTLPADTNGDVIGTITVTISAGWV